MGRTSQTIARVTQTTEIFLKNVKNTHFNTTVRHTVCTKILDTYENIHFKFVRKILQQPSNNLTKI